LPDALARADAALLDAKRSGKALVRMHMAPENPGG
jgi:PleD family two-component response regulator